MFSDLTYPVGINDLLKKVKMNRDKHLGIVERAQVKYREMAIDELDKMIADARSGRKFRRSVSLQVPANHVEDYDRAIGLFEMVKRSGADTIEISEEQYSQYVLDQWGWSNAFTSSNSTYVPELDYDE